MIVPPGRPSVSARATWAQDAPEYSREAVEAGFADVVKLHEELSDHRGSAAGGWINVLITDADVARQLLEPPKL